MKFGIDLDKDLPTCNNCGEQVKLGDNFCASCGASLNENAVMLQNERNRTIKIETAKELMADLPKDKVIAYLDSLKK